MQPPRSHSFELTQPPPAYSKYAAPLRDVMRKQPSAGSSRNPGSTRAPLADVVVCPATTARSSHAEHVLPLYSASAPRPAAPVTNVVTVAKDTFRRRVPLSAKMALGAFAAGAVVGAGFTANSSIGVKVVAGCLGAAVGAFATYAFASKSDRPAFRLARH